MKKVHTNIQGKTALKLMSRFGIGNANIERKDEEVQTVYDQVDKTIFVDLQSRFKQHEDKISELRKENAIKQLEINRSNE